MVDKKGGLPDAVTQMLLARANWIDILPSELRRFFKQANPLSEVVVVLEGSSDTPAGRRGGSGRKTLEYCAGLDHSDTDNAKRLLAHFPEHILVVAQEQAKDPFFAAWDGRHWDLQRGKEKAFAFAQQIGALIEKEVAYLKPDKEWQAAIDAAKDALAVPEGERTPGQRKLVERAERAKEQFAKRIKRRRDHAVSSKNAGRLSAMVKCAWPHILKSPDDFNAQPLRFACQNATLTFERVNAAGSTKPSSVRLRVREGHRPEDLITHLFNADFDLQARCPQWLAFLERVLPDPEVRRLVQVASGLGLIGEKVQKLFFHYGAGANGKSVYMEVICRLLGEMAVTLPATSIIGEGGNSGGASPDLARLYGRRFLRVKELPEGEDLRESLVKELTGGETIVARNLFAGYMDFDPDFVAMMSGNGYAAGAFSAPVEVIDLDELKTTLKAAIDAAAEAERLRYITAGAGQAMTYQRKAEEARACLSATDPVPADYPMLAAEIGITADDLPGVAQIVNAAHEAWIAIGAQIEANRLGAKSAINAATSVEEARSAATGGQYV